MGLLRSSAAGVCSGALARSLVLHVANRSARTHHARRPVTNVATCHECTASNAFRSVGLVGSGTASPATAPATSFARQRPCRLRLRRCPEKSRSELHQPILNTPLQLLEGARRKNHRIRGSKKALCVINFNERQQNETTTVDGTGFYRL